MYRQTLQVVEQAMEVVQKWIFFCSVRNNTIGSYTFFFLIQVFWLDTKNRSVNLEKPGIKQREEYYSNRIRAYKWHSMKNIDD